MCSVCVVSDWDGLCMGLVNACIRRCVGSIWAHPGNGLGLVIGSIWDWNRTGMGTQRAHY